MARMARLILYGVRVILHTDPFQVRSVQGQLGDTFTEGWFIPTREYQWIKLKLIEVDTQNNPKVNLELLGCYHGAGKMNLLLQGGDNSSWILCEE